MVDFRKSPEHYGPVVNEDDKPSAVARLADHVRAHTAPTPVASLLPTGNPIADQLAQLPPNGDPFGISDAEVIAGLQANGLLADPDADIEDGIGLDDLPLSWRKAPAPDGLSLMSLPAAWASPNTPGLAQLAHPGVPADLERLNSEHPHDN